MNMCVHRSLSIEAPRDDVHMHRTCNEVVLRLLLIGDRIDQEYSMSTEATAATTTAAITMTAAPALRQPQPPRSVSMLAYLGAGAEILLQFFVVANRHRDLIP